MEEILTFLKKKIRKVDARILISEINQIELQANTHNVLESITVAFQTHQDGTKRLTCLIRKENEVVAL